MFGLAEKFFFVTAAILMWMIILLVAGSFYAEVIDKPERMKCKCEQKAIQENR